MPASHSRIKLMPHGQYRILRLLTGKPIRGAWNFFDTIPAALDALNGMLPERRRF